VLIFAGVPLLTGFVVFPLLCAPHRLFSLVEG
jgi:hypothetical protein